MLKAGDSITLAAGAYLLRERLGGSAYGVVWRAQGPLGEVALKLVNREQMALAEPAQQVRWSASAEQEIRFLRSLAPWDERHLVRLLDCGGHEGLPVMALELMHGDLARHLEALSAQAKAPGIVQILGWMAQLNQALATIHQYGWRYLDLKPANILVDACGDKVKLTDFGTNRRLAETSVRSYTGTASWQAPEQFFVSAANSYDTDARSDYFALGALFYYLVCGSVPLRFCSACGQAYRERQGAGAAALLASHGGHLPTLHQDEAAQFEQRVAGALADRGAGERALTLLRMLVAPMPAQRPQHALAISRLLGAVMPGAAPLRMAA